MLKKVLLIVFGVLIFLVVFFWYIFDYSCRCEYPKINTVVLKVLYPDREYVVLNPDGSCRLSFCWKEVRGLERLNRRSKKDIIFIPLIDTIPVSPKETTPTPPKEGN